MGESGTVHPSQHPPVMTQLRTIDGVTYSVALTHRPWELPVDALVVSVGATLGQVAEAVVQEFPDADWASIPLHKVEPDAPGVLDLDGQSGELQLRWVLLATPHASDQRNAPTGTAVAIAAMT